MLSDWLLEEHSPGSRQAPHLPSAPAAAQRRPRPPAAGQSRTALPSTGGASGSEPSLWKLQGSGELLHPRTALPWQQIDQRPTQPAGDTPRTQRVEDPQGDRCDWSDLSTSGQPLSEQLIGWQTGRGRCLQTPAGSDAGRTGRGRPAGRDGDNERQTSQRRLDQLITIIWVEKPEQVRTKQVRSRWAGSLLRQRQGGVHTRPA